MTDQPCEIIADAPLDEITMLLGHLPGVEYEARRQLRTARTIASHRVLFAQTGSARMLLWLVCDVATANIFTTHPAEVLEDLAKLCRQLLIVAEQAEQLGEIADGMD